MTQSPPATPPTQDMDRRPVSWTHTIIAFFRGPLPTFIVVPLLTFIVVPLLIVMGLRDFMALMAVTITLEFSETKALYLFLFIRSMLFFVCAGGVWKRHRLIGLFMTHALLLGSLAFNFYLKQIDPVEMSRATDAMLAAFAGVILLHFMGYFRKTSEEGETTETPPAATEDKALPQDSPQTSTEPEKEADDEPVAPEQNDVHRDETAEKQRGNEKGEPT